MSKGALSWVRRLDPSAWVIVAGAAVRVAAALQFDPINGYDARAHFLYADILRAGSVPRVDSGLWTAQNPPLFYALALAFGVLGLGRRGGQLVSVAAGIVRLVVADRLFRTMEVSVRAGAPPARLGPRLFANLVHAFLPFAIRIDVFYSPESLAATLAVTATAVALRGSAWRTGVALGLALLTKASAVAALPATLWALRGARRLAIAGAIAAAMLSLWAGPNLRSYGNPYPSGYYTDDDPVWSQPILARHPASFYLPRWRWEALTWPYWERPVSMPNAFFLEAWGDYYNYLSLGPRFLPPPQTANMRALTRGMHITHVALAHLGLLFVAALAVGTGSATRRIAAGAASRSEVALAILGAGYLAVALVFATVVPREDDGAVKATYALAAAPILSFWTGTTFARLARSRIGAVVAVGIAAAPAVLAVVQRVVFRGP